MPVSWQITLITDNTIHHWKMSTKKHEASYLIRTWVLHVGIQFTHNWANLFPFIYFGYYYWVIVRLLHSNVVSKAYVNVDRFYPSYKVRIFSTNLCLWYVSSGPEEPTYYTATRDSNVISSRIWEANLSFNIFGQRSAAIWCPVAFYSKLHRNATCWKSLINHQNCTICFHLIFSAHISSLLL